MRRVLVVQRRMPHYRIAFFEALRTALEADGIALTLAVGVPTQAEQAKHDEAQLEGAVRLSTRYAMGGRICWLPFKTKGFDLVIVSQENRFLYHLWALRPWRQFRVAMMGHGANLAAARCAPPEIFKRWVTRRADWWFAYTELSRDVLQRAGCPIERITVFNNAIDTRSVRRQCAEVSELEVAQLRNDLSARAGKTAVFIGSLYAQKQLDFLIEAANEIHARVPDFVLVIAGDGPDRAIVQSAAQRHAWVKWAGPVRGHAKAVLMSAADVMLMPHAMGLSILDGFAAGLPICATSAPGHGPELHYLRAGANGLQTDPEVATYAQAVSALLCDPDRLSAFKRAAIDTADELSLEDMTKRFAVGIREALDAPRR